MAKTYSKNKGRRSSRGSFLALPKTVIDHDNFLKLSYHANKLLIDLGSQYYGTNNGDLCATWSFMVERGWKSKETLNNSLRELEYYGFIVVTRYGDRKRPTLYGFTWRRIDKAIGDCKHLANQITNDWKKVRKQFVSPSKRRKQKKSVTRLAGQTSTAGGAKTVKLKVV